LLVANDDDGFAGDVGREKTFGIGDGAFRAVYFSALLAECSDELSGALENSYLFDFKNRRVGIKARGECLRALDLFMDVEVKRLYQHD